VAWVDVDILGTISVDANGLQTDSCVITVDVTVAVVWVGGHVDAEFNGAFADWKRS
jgi:hypothetical protein